MLIPERGFSFELGLCEQLKNRAFIPAIGILCLVHQIEKLKILFLRDRVVLVVMALSASHGCPHPNGPGCIHPVNHSHIAKLLITCAAFVVGHGIAVKGSGYQLGIGWILQQVSGKLLDGELVKWQVGIEAVDHIIPESPNGSRGIIRITCRVGIPGLIQPPSGPVFTVGRLAQQLIHKTLKCIRSMIRYKGIHFFNSRRQPSQIQSNPPGKQVGISTLRKLLRHAGQVVQHKAINGVVRLGQEANSHIAHVGYRWSLGQFVGPMTLVGGSLGYPTAQGFDLFWRNLLAR